MHAATYPALQCRARVETNRMSILKRCLDIYTEIEVLLVFPTGLNFILLKNLVITKISHAFQFLIAFISRSFTADFFNLRWKRYFN